MPRLPNFGHFKLKIAIICWATLMSLKTQKFYIIQIEFDSYSCRAIYYQGSILGKLFVMFRQNIAKERRLVQAKVHAWK